MPNKPASDQGRSVVDYVTEEELQKALSTVTPQGIAKNDWVLPVPDPEAEEQTLEGEMQRLLTLKSYQLLDAEKEEAFDKLTQEACEIFGVPTSLISLIDMGRQFLFSNTGCPGDVRETPRDVAFCSHTILNKKGIVVVNDTQCDDRFKNNPLVTQAPHLRFYAGAPLVSPEGHKLGTFCVEGPEPRPGGLNDQEKEKLKDYAAKAMELMVERRRKLRDRLANQTVSDELRRHAGVTTNLGGILYESGQAVTAMRLFQESVQTIMYVEEEQGADAKPPAERQQAMSQLLQLLSVETIPAESRTALLKQVASLYAADTPKAEAAAAGAATAAGGDGSKTTVVPSDGIAGLFSVDSKLKGSASTAASTANKSLPGLFFGESFKINLEGEGVKYSEKPFTVPLEECSKATLFNMGLIHWAWNSPDLALQFFHLAASVSVKMSPLGFDPVDLGCVNNMAQIHLQYGHANDAMKMLVEALEKGNKTLASIYSETDSSPTAGAASAGDGGGEEEDGTAVAADEDIGPSPVAVEQDARKTRRFRRKLARTVMSMGHVHYFNCDYNAALTTCRDALGLLDEDTLEEKELAAIWHNMSVLLYHQGKKVEAMTYLDKFLELAAKLDGPDHVQVADGLYRKGQIMFEIGNLHECMKPLNEALRIRQLRHGKSHLAVAESLLLVGKVYLAREEYDFALNALQQCLEIQRKTAPGSSNGQAAQPSFDIAQTLLEIGRTHHAKGDLKASLEVYMEVADLTRKFFGPTHAFVARIVTIVGNICVEMGDVNKSVPFMEEAARIRAEQGLPVENVNKDAVAAAGAQTISTSPGA